MPWERGATVAVRSRPDGAVGYTFPAIVVRDSPEVVALFQPSGTICKRRTGERGGPNGRTLVRWDGRYVDVVRSSPTVHVWAPDAPFWLIRTWNGTSYEGWYINLAEPWRCNSFGFDTLDRILDISVAPDRSSWRWKDEDELAWAVEQGGYTAREAAGIRQDGRAALGAMAAGEPPFGIQWRAFEPDATWGVPVLPDGWDRSEERADEHRSGRDPP